MRSQFVAAMAFVALQAGLTLLAAEPMATVLPMPSLPMPSKPPSEVLLPEPPELAGASTLGGMQFWTDELVFHDWRIQRNTFTEHCRLLNGRDERITYGSFDECRAKLAETKATGKFAPLKPQVVIVLHGLFGYRGRMEPLAKYLREHTEYEVLNVGYASTRGDVSSHAVALAKVIDGLEGVKEINFVGHSLGNLVVRRYLGDSLDPKGAGKIDPRIKRMVMLAPPNQGAHLATEIGASGLASVISGAPARELGVSFDAVREHLATPPFEFGVIAACCSSPKGGNPALPGDDDWVVCVDETKLPGARDFLVVSSMHQSVTHLPQAHECVARFLEKGYFVSEAERKPLAVETPEKKP